MCFSSGGGDNGSAAARQQEQQRSARISAGMGDIDTTFSKFNPGYYDDYSKKLMDFWRPDIDRQFADANDKLTFTFANSNPGGSSASSRAFGRLKEERDRKLQEAGDNATAEANKLRQSVEQQRGVVVSQLNATADPYAATRSAQAQVESLSAPPAYSPLGDLFTNLTDQFATAQVAARSGAPGWGFSIGGAAPASGMKKNGSMRVVG